MATFAELENRVKFIVDITGFRMPVNIRKLLHEAENRFIETTCCTQKRIDYYVEATDYEFDGTVTNIAFTKGSGSTMDTITDSDSGFVTDGFAADMEITVDGSTSNDGTYTIYSVAAGVLTLNQVGVFTAESGVADMTITADIIPERVSLPSDFYKEYLVEFGNYILQPVNMSNYDSYYKATVDIAASTPYNYFIEGDYLHIEPRPASADTLRIWYHYYQTDDTTTSPIIPTIEHLKLVNYTIGMLYEMDQKINEAQVYYNKFERDCLEAKLKYSQRFMRQRRISQDWKYESAF